MSNAPHPWMVAQILCGAPDPLGKSLGGGRIILRNVILRFNQIGKCRTRPAEFQVFTPHRAKALRTSSSVAKAPRSAAAIPSSTALRKRASSITSSQEASGGSSSAKAWTFWRIDWLVSLMGVSFQSQQISFEKPSTPDDYRKDGTVWQTAESGALSLPRSKRLFVVNNTFRSHPIFGSHDHQLSVRRDHHTVDDPRGPIDFAD